MPHRRPLPGGGALALAAPAIHACARPRVSGSEIRVGNTMPCSGPASGYAAIGQVEAAHFRMLNAQGGINGRKITFITCDDAANPPKTVEQVRRLIERDEVALLFNTLGTAANTAVVKYVTQRKVPRR